MKEYKGLRLSGIFAPLCLIKKEPANSKRTDTETPNDVLQDRSPEEGGRSIRKHKELILNWFRTKKEFSSGVVEGLNNKVKLTMRKSYGLRALDQ